MREECDKQTDSPERPESRHLFRAGLIPDRLENLYYGAVSPIVTFLANRKLNPNWLSGTGFVLVAIAGLWLARGQYYLASVFVILGGFLDSIDGSVAARTNRVTRFGAIYDSVLDRYSDTVVFLSLAICFHRQGHAVSALVAILALVGSFMTSYLMAVGRSQGIDYRAGFLRRQERMAIISAALLLSFLDPSLKSALGGILPGPETAPNVVIATAIWFIALFSNITAVQRLLKLRELTTKG